MSAVTLDFPNPSRSFDEVRNAVRFIGHDGMFEVRFFIEADALAGTRARTGRTEVTEAACLAAFDRGAPRFTRLPASSIRAAAKRTTS